jgi:hypothetical protein
MVTPRQALRDAQARLKDAIQQHGRHSREAADAQRSMEAARQARLGEEVGVYVPAPGSRAERMIRPESGIVAEHWAEEGEVGRKLLAYFQDEIPNSNVRTFADRVSHAAGRLAVSAPTIAFAVLDEADLQRVGTYSPMNGEVQVDPEHEDALRQWLGAPALDPEEMLTSEGAGKRRRELQAFIRQQGPMDPATRGFVEREASRLGVRLG